MMRNPFVHQPPEGFTHYATFYGVPCYFKDDDDSQGCSIVGRYIGCDLLIDYLCPLIQWGVETLRALRDGMDYEPQGFEIQLCGEIED